MAPFQRDDLALPGGRVASIAPVLHGRHFLEIVAGKPLKIQCFYFFCLFNCPPIFKQPSGMDPYNEPAETGQNT
jgi:hypothetical protein